MKRVNPYEVIRIRRRRRNVEGFMDDEGRFHPIRGSTGYSYPAEGGKKRKGRGRRRRKAAKARSRSRRRRR